MELERAQRLMKEKGVDVLIASTQDNFYYASGYKAHIGNSHPIITVVPADLSLAPCMIVSDFSERQARQRSFIDDVRSYPLWMPIIDANELIGDAVKAIKRPHQFSPEEVFGLFADVLKEKGLHEATIGIEKNFFENPEINSLLKKQNPKARFIAADNLFWALRKVKTGEEIEALRLAAELAVKGIQAVLEGDVLGASLGELTVKYAKGVWEAATPDIAMDLKDIRFEVSSGDHFKTMGNPTYRVAKGDVLWEDHGLSVLGYIADMGRTFSAGKPSEMQKKLFMALKEGYEEAVSKVKPGVKMKELYWALQKTVNKRGYEWYARGHMGHNVGIGSIEQPPFVSPDEETELEPDMVICIECGVYVVGQFGAFQIEDMFLVTPKGHEILTKMPRDMIEL
jgi:Xaa-Pro aminopeptidase